MSIITGLAPAVVSKVIGLAFGEFATFTATQSALEAAVAAGTVGSAYATAVLAIAAEQLRSKMLVYAGCFLLLAGVVLVSWTGSTALWVINGERTATELRKEVYKGITSRGMEWFDLGMGIEHDANETEGEEGTAGTEEKSSTQGAGGLMGQFNRSIDDARLAANSTCGLLLQYFTSFLSCLSLALYSDYRLTFVILGSVPFLILIVSVTEFLSAGLIARDRQLISAAASKADRVLGAITTVKAFNAEEKEHADFKSLSDISAAAYIKLHVVWGARQGLSQFLLFAMFVSGFWFGSWLVQTGRATTATAQTCFWAALLTTTYIQTALPLLVVLEKGKIGMASILDLARHQDDEPELERAEVARPAAPAPGSGRLPATPFSPAFSPTLRNRRLQHQRITSGDISRPLALQGLGAGLDDFDAPDDFKTRFPDEYDLEAKHSPNLFCVASPVTPGSCTPMLLSLANMQAIKGGRPGRTAEGQAMAKLRPVTFSGELSLRNVTFHYPTRPAPAPPALENVSMYLFPSETTYIVGGSGSGKSTVSSMLLALYQPEAGRIEVDEQGLEWIDPDWLRGHVACVSQGASILFDGTVHDNVAIGVVGQIRPDGTARDASDVSREEVVAACKGTLIHNFVNALPQGYDTWLSGERGAALSGGQRQRLALARAWVREPTVLIMDEATSALDAMSRHLVAEACKKWRRHKTTIVITHDLTPIEATDFVYVMADGRVVEQGYRADLEANFGGPWHTLAHSLDHADEDDEDEDEDEQEALESPMSEAGPNRLGHDLKNSLMFPRRSLGATPYASGGSPRASTASPSMQRSASAQSTPRLRLDGAFDPAPDTSLGLATDADADASSDGHLISAFARASRDLKAARRVSAQMMERAGSGQSLSVALPRAAHGSPRTPPRLATPLPGRGRPTSTIYTPDSFGPNDAIRTLTQSPVRYRSSPRPGSHMSATTAMEFAGEAALTNRKDGVSRRRIKHESIFDDVHLAKAIVSQLALDEAETEGELGAVVVHDQNEVDHSGLLPDRQISLWKLAKIYYSSVPDKLTLWFGMFLSILLGACTPVFSWLLSKLMTGLGTSTDQSLTMIYSLLVLLIALIDGTATFVKFVAFERTAMRWTAHLRVRVFGLVLCQDKAFFDRPENSTSRLVQLLVKDSEDARTMIGTILPQFVVILSMVLIGITWAMATSWQLTLVGLGLAPVFIVSTALQAQALQKIETGNRALRQDLGFKFHQAVSNVRVIRSMSIESTFQRRFDQAAADCFVGAKKAAVMTGLGGALGACLTYLAEAIMIYVGAVLVAKGQLTYGNMNEAFSLFMFAVTFAMQMMTSLPGITKSHRALIDLTRLIELGTDTVESEGRMTFPIAGEVRFDNVRFAYPARPGIEVLHGVSFTIAPGQCVGIVGPSGSGKSTVTALLQRLYEPSSGRILLDGRPLSRVDVKYLRNHIAMVSQHPALFDSSVSANIAYGMENPHQAIIEHAARQAYADEFVRALPSGYNTLLGENASLISGGQAQRLQIARALVRPRELLVLDECTSALDQSNQELVMDTIREVKKGRTTLVVTHKMAVMEMCDFLIVVDGGHVVEVGSVKELRAKEGGVFAALAGGGEWEH